MDTKMQKKEKLCKLSISIQVQQGTNSPNSIGSLVKEQGANLKDSFSVYEPIVKADPKDRLYFKEHFSELLKKYNGHYVAIHNQTVIDSDPNPLSLLNRIAIDRLKGKNYYVQKVDEKFDYQIASNK